jgi:hypothetical protein
MRDRWKSMLKTGALVTVVTLLVWVWAENESISRISASPRVAVAGDERLAATVLENGWTGTVTCSLRGSNAALDTAQRVLRETVVLQPGIAGVPSQPGEHGLDMALVLREHPALKRLGVTFDDVSPSLVRVRIDEVVTRSVPLTLNLEGLELDGVPSIVPPTAELRLPKPIADALPTGYELRISLPDGAGASLRDDQSQTLAVAVPIPALTMAGGARPLGVEPSTVAVTLRAKSRTESIVLPTVPVWISLPPTEGTRWDVEVLESFVADVTVTGPREAIAALRDGRESPRAWVLLSSDDLERRIEEKQVVFSTVPTPLGFRAARTVVRLRITARER